MTSDGFGRVYQSVMRDPRLSAESKAIYAYLASMAGADGICFPSMELMQHELNLGKNRLQKHLQKLIDFGIVDKTRQRNGNLWGKNVYEIKSGTKNFGAVEHRAVENEAVEGREVEDEAAKKKRLNTNSFNSNYYEQVVELFNSICQSYSKVVRLSDSRKKAIHARMTAGYTLEDFRNLFEMAEGSSFLKGQNSRNWRADFDWLISDRNMPKVIEGRYSEQQEGGTNDEEERGTGYILFK